jgi:hypothetical protein
MHPISVDKRVHMKSKIDVRHNCNYGTIELKDLVQF